MPSLCLESLLSNIFVTSIVLVLVFTPGESSQFYCPVSCTNACPSGLVSLYPDLYTYELYPNCSGSSSLPFQTTLVISLPHTECPCRDQNDRAKNNCMLASFLGSYQGYGACRATYPAHCTDDEPCWDLCFPAEATVTLEDGSSKTMRDLRVGDVVLAAPGVFSTVYTFSHRKSFGRFPFVAIRTASTNLLLSASHYLYVNGTLVPASAVRVGDTLTAADGEATQVTHVDADAEGEGLYNPHTLAGTIVVDGVVTSTYTTAVEPWVADALLWPVRAVYRATGVDVAGGVLAEGWPSAARVLRAAVQLVNG